MWLQLGSQLLPLFHRFNGESYDHYYYYYRLAFIMWQFRLSLKQYRSTDDMVIEEIPTGNCLELSRANGKEFSCERTLFLIIKSKHFLYACESPSPITVFHALHLCAYSPSICFCDSCLPHSSPKRKKKPCVEKRVLAPRPGILLLMSSYQ